MALIVTVEDDNEMAGMLAAALSSAGHTVRVADSPQQAMHLVEWQRPDLMILDHRMPGMDGLETARLLRAGAATATMPLMMLAAKPPEQAREVVDRVMTKPAGMRTVTAAAHELLSSSRDVVPPAGPPLTNRGRIRAVGRLLDRTDPVALRMLSALAAEVAALTGAPTAAVTLVLSDAVAYVASVGVPEPLATAGGVPAEWAPCSMVVGRDEPVLITDTHHDPAHRDNPVVVRLGVRSYAGVPLHDAAGIPVGTLCVLDRVPFAFDEGTLARLATAAAHAELLLRTTV
ncbi:response regulator [Actinoplanes sp. CA-252034]|uniref:response regulator n=1 Tax=Actinoplanes sp. CA-252034 TaxID=3239906 RepID=UPI003D98C715